jgi:pimeloyl-ACP methyl ester carboxylesterase
MYGSRYFLLALSAAIIAISVIVSAVEQCPVERGGGLCPDGNTCCPRYDGSSGCIPNDMGKYTATCCPDRETGCPVGYACDAIGKGCFVVNQTKYSDKLVQVLPRYRLCNASGIEHVYGLNMGNDSELAYYSSHGPIETLLSRGKTYNNSAIDMALLVIHGAGRNGDDYFCTAKAAVELQNSFKNVLIIAPQFYSETDERPQPSLLYWRNDKDGPWRYGADSLGPQQVGSFSALDIMIQKIWDQLPHLERLVVAGHSSGGQIVQRWSLLSSIWDPEKMLAVVANPSSFAYLSPLRVANGRWEIPSGCPQYDQWEWGLSRGGSIDVPYRDRAVQNVSGLILRFQDRQVTYLAGSQDRCNVSDFEGWCYSHGLETTCMDEVQGKTRLKRSALYLSSLRRLGFKGSHRHRIVPGVGHDHAMMFQSPCGIDTLFGRDYKHALPAKKVY